MIHEAKWNCELLYCAASDVMWLRLAVPSSSSVCTLKSHVEEETELSGSDIELTN